MTILKGKVTDADNKPLSGTSVKVKNTTMSTISEDTGGFYFRFNTQDGNKNYTLNIKKDGYKISQVNVFLKKDTTTRTDTIILIKI